MFLVSAFSLVATLYASIFQFDTIINSFIAEGENAHFYQVTSFFASKNLYGLMIFIGMLSLLIAFLMRISRRVLALSSPSYGSVFILLYLGTKQPFCSLFLLP